jgi:hypothetical protein
VTREEELAALNAATALRKPRVDPFEQSRLDRLEHAAQAKRAPVVLVPVKKPYAGGGILKVDKALKDAGVE